ncbi:MAG: sugar transferase, partial [Eubacterium sp.]
MSKRKKIQYALEFSCGLISLFLANVICYFFFSSVIIKILEYPAADWREYYLVLFITYIVVFACFSSSLNMLVRSRWTETLSTIRNCAITYVVFATLLLLTKNPIVDSRSLFLGSFLLYLIFSLGLRFITKKFMLHKISNSKHATQTGVITLDDSKTEDFVNELKTDWSKNIKAVAILDAQFYNGGYYSASGMRIDEISGVPVVANRSNLMGWIRTAALDEVYINLPDSMKNYTTDVIEELEDMGVTVNVNIPSLEAIVENSKFDNLSCTVKAGYPMAVFSPSVQSDRALFIKRLFDIIGGLVGCIISLPIILITAIPLLIESPGPLIFKQERVGKNGRIFNIYKLRSMYVDAEERKQALMEQNKMDGFMFKMDNDPRITKVGRFIRKTSIDELPQFWNVLKGDMSLVGTRPPTVDEFEKYESHHKRRLSLKPGITGLWQVSGRSDIQDFEEVVRLDCEYIDNWSLLLDIKLLFKTVGVV